MSSRKIKSAPAMAAGSVSRKPAQDPAPTPAPQGIPLLIKIILGMQMVSFLSIVLAMTPLTHNLDDIKITLFLILGPVLMLGAAAVMAWRSAPLPPKISGIALAGYGLVLLVSTLASAYRWTGWFQIMFVWSAAGFFMAAFCIGSHRTASRFFLRFLVVQMLLLALIGFFAYDLTNSPDHRSLVAGLFRFIYGTGQPTSISSIYNLLFTLQQADNQMQATVLSRDFFAGYSVLFLPFALLLALDPGPGRPVLWRVTGLITAILTTLVIFFCQSKGEYIFGFISCLFYALMFFRVGQLPDLRRRHLIIWSVAILGLLGLVGWMQSPILFGQLKSLGFSLGSRGIIWGGAWKIFQDFPILGGGPGTFRIYFPNYRSPDYFNHEISNVTVYAHNYFLDLLAETGLCGLICFCVFVGALVYQGLRYASRHQDQRLRLWLIASIAGLIAIFGSNMSSPNARWVIGAMPMWTVIGFLAGLVRQAEGWTSEETGNAKPQVVTATRLKARKLVPVSLATVGALMFIFSSSAGIRYFKSAVVYAQGLQYMEWAYQRLEAQDTDSQKIIDQMIESGKFFDQSLAIDPTNTSAYYKMGSVFTTLSQLYQNISDELGRQGHAQEADDATYLANQYLIKAKESYETLSKYDPDYAEIHYNLGIIYQYYAHYLRTAKPQYGAEPPDRSQAQHYEELSRQHLDQMGKMSAKAEVAALWGNQYKSMGDSAKARDIFREASQRYPDNKQLALQYYQVAMEAKDFKGAGEALERLWLKAPADDSLLNELLSISMEHHLDELLKRTVERLGRINPIHPRLHEARIILASWQGQAAQVLAAAQDYIRCGGQDLDFYSMGAQAAQAMGQAGEAQDINKRIVRLDRDGKTTFGQQARRQLAQPPVAPAPGSAAVPAPVPAAVAPAGSADRPTSQSGTSSSTPGAPARS